jgi:hypothetical protein
MLFPTFQEVARYRDMTTTFGGYNHQLSCQDGQFYDMKNMTSQYYPILSPRQNRGIVKQLFRPQGILDKEDLMWIDDNELYINGEKIDLGDLVITDEAPKTIAKMGAYVVIMPDAIWYNTDNGECGNIASNYENKDGEEITFSLCEANGSAIQYQDAAYYESHDAKDFYLTQSEVFTMAECSKYYTTEIFARVHNLICCSKNQIYVQITKIKEAKQ